MTGYGLFLIPAAFLVWLVMGIQAAPWIAVLAGLVIPAYALEPVITRWIVIWSVPQPQRLAIAAASWQRLVSCAAVGGWVQGSGMPPMQAQARATLLLLRAQVWAGRSTS